MKDIVKRLREVTGFVRFETGDRVAAAACLSEEAACEIEKLRLALHAIWLQGGTAETYDPVVEKICRDILEPEER